MNYKQINIGGAMDFNRHSIKQVPINNSSSSGDARTDLYEILYDDAWRSEESDAASLYEVPVDYIEYLKYSRKDSGCEDPVNSAIAEVSHDFLSGGGPIASKQHNGDSDESHVSTDTDFKLINARAAYARYPESAGGLSDNDWNPYGTESDTNITPRLPGKDLMKSSSSGISSHISFNPPLHSTEKNASPTTCGGLGPVTSMSDIYEHTEISTAVTLRPDITLDFSSISHVSEKTLSPMKTRDSNRVNTKLNETMREKNTTSELGLDNKTKQVANNAGNMPHVRSGLQSKEISGRISTGSCQMETADREKSLQGDSLQRKYQTHGVGQGSAAINYDQLQRDLQEIQDSLCRTLGLEPHHANHQQLQKLDEWSNKETPDISDCDQEIIPSTSNSPNTSTDKIKWALMTNLGYHQQREHNKKDISSPKYQGHFGHSDGDETQTSGSSDKLDDHEAADRVLAEMSELLQPGTVIDTSRDIDEVIFNLRSHRREVKSGYKQLNNQGLAEKVFRILADQAPEIQADVILTEVSEEEKDLKAKYALQLYNKDFNFSSSSDIYCQASNLGDNVRKKLDLSNVSSEDTTMVSNKLYMPRLRGFNAFDGMTQFLSSQMQRAAERTFNHSLDMHPPPQVIQCYPLVGYERAQSEGQCGQVGHDQQDEIDGNRSPAAKSSSPKGIEEVAIVGGQSNIHNPNSVKISSKTDHLDHTSLQLYAGQHNNNHCDTSSPPDSDSSTGRWKDKYRPYKPPGSSDVYYTESDAMSVADSVTTIESTHLGSDDARGPTLPQSALGSRKDPPKSAGIYGNRKHSEEAIVLTPIQEKPGMDDLEPVTKETIEEVPKQSGVDEERFKHASKLIKEQTMDSTGDSHLVVDQVAPRGTDYQKTNTTSNNSAQVAGHREELTKSQDVPSHGQRDSQFSKMPREDDKSRPVGRPLYRYEQDNSSWKEQSTLRAQNTSSVPRDQSEDDLRRVSTKIKQADSSEQHPPYSQEDWKSIRYETRHQMASQQTSKTPAISPAFHRALSPDLLQAIGRRSPLIGGVIEKSLARPPALSANKPARTSREHTKQSQPGPPTFLARERSQFSREASHSTLTAPPAAQTVSYSNTLTAPPATQTVRYAADKSAQSLQRLDDVLETRSAGLQKKPERLVEITLENMSSDSQDMSVDHQPMSQRAKLLTQALAQEEDIPTNINQLWEKFKAMNQSPESSMNSSRMDDVADLLRNPAQHHITQYMKEREEYRIQRQERSERERERKLKEHQQLIKWNSYPGELSNSSEDISSSKENEKNQPSKEKKKYFPDGEKDKNGSGLTAESLFSIPEDASFEVNSPSKSNMASKQRVHRQKHIIDPNMNKLRDRISKQRKRVEKEELKEIHRMDKLRKLERLLLAKKQGKISDQTFDHHLETISLSASSTDNSQDGGRYLPSHNTTPLSDDSTTAKDSSAEMLTWKAEKHRRIKEMSKQEQSKHRNYTASSNQRKQLRVNHTNPGRAKPLLNQKRAGSSPPDSSYDFRTPRSWSTDFNAHHTGRPHNLYSPYSRTPFCFDHVPKLKLSPTSRSSSEDRSESQDLYKTSDDSSHYKIRPPADLKLKTRGKHQFDRHKKQDFRGNQDDSSENEPSESKQTSGIAWDIPLDSKDHHSKPSQTFPLRERKIVTNTEPRTKPGQSREQSLSQKKEKVASIWETSEHPEGIPRRVWEEVVNRDPLASKTNHWDVDPLMDRVQYILDRGPLGYNGEERGEGFSLQEACLAHKQGFISKCKERQKRIALARESRHMQECLRLEREAIFAEQGRNLPANLYAHPYSDNLFQPKRRVLSKQEMKELTLKRYKKLAEVKEKEENSKRSEKIKLNRLRVQIFNKKVQQETLRKCCMRQR